MGITGVGKSSLINYLAGEELAEAGISSHAGGMTRGIHKYPIIINGQQCNVFDSEGLETSHAEYWKNLMDNELLYDTYEQPMSNWYHIVVYCIGANSGRVQPFELEMIEKLLDAGYGVIIAFTKADVVTEEELSALQDTIDTHFDGNAQLTYVPICSIKTRNNNLEGKEELGNAIFSSWGTSLVYRLPDYVYSCLDYMEDWGNTVVDWIEEQDFGLFGRSKEDVLNDVNGILAEQIGEWNEMIKERQNNAMKDIKSVYAMLNQVLNISSLSFHEMKSTSHIGHIDASIFEGRSTSSAIAQSVALGTLAFVNPIVGISLGLASLFRSNAHNKDAKYAIRDAFVKQHKQLVEAYSNQKEIFDYTLGASLGFIYGYRGLGTKYLLGQGVVKNTEKALENFQKVIDFVEESNYQWTDPYSEFYYSYIYFMRGNNDVADKWLHLAAEHGSTRAKLVLKGIPYREAAENEDYDN